MVTIAGSTKLWAFNLAEELEKHGLLDKLLTTYSYSKNTIARNFIRRVDKENIPLSKIDTNLLLALPIGTMRKKSYLWNIIFDRWVAWKLKKSDSKIFIGWSGMSLYSIRAAKKKGMFTIVERGSSHIVIQNKILKEEYKRYGIKFSINRMLIQREIKEYEEADFIAVPSFFVRDSFIERGIPVEKLFLNSYGANESFRTPVNKREAGDKFRIVYLGTLSIRKGLIYFFEALKLLDIPGEAFEVLFVGKVEPEMEKILASSRLANWQVMGHVDHYKLPEILGICDVGVQPSLEEGLSMVIPQMMACAVPVILTPNTGGQNIIEDGRNGFIVPVRNAEAIKEKLMWLYQHPEQLRVMKEQAAVSILDRFTWKAYGSRYADFIRNTVLPAQRSRLNLKSGKSMVIAIYTHPEYYPPLLNAIDELAKNTDHLYVLSRNLKENQWKYPSVVEMAKSGEIIDIRAVEKQSINWKLNSFLKFTFAFYKLLTRRKHEWVVCQDPISLLAYRLIRHFIFYKPRLWYHNHDVVELSAVRKYSIGYYSVKSEKQFFSHIDLFSLPSPERLSSFPFQKLKGPHFIVPNYPSMSRLRNDQVVKPDPNKMLKLIYQGHLGNDHGLESFVRFIESENGVSLTLIGPGNKEFIQRLRQLIDDRKLNDRIFLLQPVPYSALREITLQHHVGLAVHEPVNIAFRTAAMASNKIYEYAASGLPVLYFDDEHYKKYLTVYPWAIPTDLSIESIHRAVSFVRSNYEELSGKALKDFLAGLNFGAAYKPVLEYINDSKKERL
jgi:glycosyltransferase involved in cell wall biosynthesis